MEISESQEYFDDNWNSLNFDEINSRFGELWRERGKCQEVDRIGNLWFTGMISENDAIKYLEANESK